MGEHRLPDKCVCGGELEMLEDGDSVHKGISCGQRYMVRFMPGMTLNYDYLSDGEIAIPRKPYGWQIYTLIGRLAK